MMIYVSILELTLSEIYDGDLVTEEEAKATEDTKLMATEEGVEYWAKMEKENLK